MRLTSADVLPQGDPDHLVRQVPKEKLLRVSFLSRVRLENEGLLVLMVREV